jgi:hypothetical protein
MVLNPALKVCGVPFHMDGRKRFDAILVELQVEGVSKTWSMAEMSLAMFFSPTDVP